MERRRPVGLVVAVVVVLLTGAVAVERGVVETIGAALDGQQVPGVDVRALPPAARESLPTLAQQLGDACPELPVLWALAWSAGTPEGSLPETWDPLEQLGGQLDALCADFRQVTAHQLQTRETTSSALDALVVCRLIGCDGVTGSRTGVPVAGEAGCDAGCAGEVAAAVARVRRAAQEFAAPVVTRPVAGTPPHPYSGPDTGCVVPDPTGTGKCVTGATAWLTVAVAENAHQGPVRCWSEHAWNPASDHPRGRACDYTIGRLGQRPTPQDTARGWALAHWLRAYAEPLGVSYVIWQGTIWSRHRDAAGWRPYDGGGVYDADDVTGGHFDHVHVSLADFAKG